MDINAALVLWNMPFY